MANVEKHIKRSVCECLWNRK